MSNEKCKPPDNTKKFTFKGYDEIYVPATRQIVIYITKINNIKKKNRKFKKKKKSHHYRNGHN
jgi:hypothetical protein